MVEALPVNFLMIGSEILDARRQDLLVAMLAHFLRSHGAYVKSTYFVRDEPEQMRIALEHFSRADPKTCLVTSGGLGPTSDDRTKEVITHFLGEKLEANAKLLADLTNQYDIRGKIYQPETNQYHYLSASCQGFLNPVGWAPALLFSNGQSKIFSLPGVPAEFHGLLERYWDHLFGSCKQSRRVTITVRTRGIPEVELFSKRAPDLWHTLEQLGGVSSLPGAGGVDIGVTQMVSTPEEERTLRLAVEASVSAYDDLRAAIWEVGERSLAQVVVDQARSQGITIATCESCTGGLIGSNITDIPGSSHVFLGGAITYANELKELFAHVSAESIATHGAVSLAVAQEMAIGICRTTGADFGISSTGIAGPGGATENKSVGTVAFAVAKKNQVISSKVHHLADRGRAHNKEIFAQYALHQLLLAITPSVAMLK